ncbi:hypothetical protein G7K_5563-t1 [Saitoella complicata NRRL Y-17804]|uniref:Eukaryotic translation initiation factor 1A n=1 Tax=Saitoella complicata (strain BCRC 22490 / CBS 7301 / JCM 7358 / NBRC 10748 / NRRL Y-17804) TaxID=698492 RepID=A0A0E9NNU1_SAICN|nr:hypothetical protein G7K_5563-t1 [Saitoella complicata NRRL Y-17804]
MPKNKGKGGKNRRRGKNENEDEKRELVFKEDGQEYAQVTKMLGNGRLEAMCFDGERRLAHIRGKLRKKVWINQGDIILLSLREYQDEKADVIQKYNADEARNLKAYGELPENAKINETDMFGGEDLSAFTRLSSCSSFVREEKERKRVRRGIKKVWLRIEVAFCWNLSVLFLSLCRLFLDLSHGAPVVNIRTQSLLGSNVYTQGCFLSVCLDRQNGKS